MAQETGYTIVYKEENDPNWTEVTLPADTVDYTIPGLIPGHKYQIGVKAEGDDSTVVDSPYSNMLEIYTYLQMAVVTITGKNVWLDRFSIVWSDTNPAEIIKDYTVSYREVGATEWISGNTTAVPYEVTGLTPNTDFEFTVRVNPLDTDRYLSATTAIDTISTNDSLESPSPFTIKDNGNNNYSLEWTDNSESPYNETGFKIERTLNGSAWETFTTTGPDVISYSTDLSHGVYEFRVIALGDGVVYFDSDPSEERSLTVVVELNPPVLSFDSKTVDTIVIDWTDPNS